MAALTLNGITVPIADGSVDEPKREIGATDAAFDGTLNRSRQSVKRDLSFTTTPMSAADYLAWDGYIRGLGEVWSFDTSLYGSKGTGPNAGYTSGLDINTVHSKFGTGNVNSSSPLTITYPTALGSNWTVALWHGTYGTPSVYHHYVVCSDGKKWVDGVRNDAAVTTFFSVSSGSLILGGTATGAFDDVVALPYLVPTSWPPIWGVATSAFSLLPELTAAGDLVNEASTRRVMGASESSKPMNVVLAGSSRSVAVRTMTVLLSEV